MTDKRRILLGITGSIAAIKAPLIARELMRRDFEVSAALTEGALEFTTGLALSALTRNEVYTEVFPKGAAADAGTWHIHLARSVAGMLIAPCTASTIGKLAGGIYDNAVLLLAASLPRTTPLVLAPAMDEEMWLQSVVQSNLATLASRGVAIIPPVHGALASGLFGAGRMEEPTTVVDKFVELIADQAEGPLQNKRVLITGGPTYEPIDPVRFIGNRSSGKMAAALASEAAKMGAVVTLVMGPSSASTPAGVTRVDVETAEQMRNAVLRLFPSSDAVIMNAAVSDFAPAVASDIKLKKREMNAGAEATSIALRPTPDILREIGAQKQPGQVLVGFALETGDRAEAYATAKLEEKGLDMIVLNRADEPGAGFGGDTNRVTILTHSDRSELPMLSKEACAKAILERMSELKKLVANDGSRR